MRWYLLATRLAPAILATMGLAACEYLEPNLREKLPLQTVTATAPPPEEPAGEPPPSAEVSPPALEQPEIYRGTNVLVRPVPVQRPAEQAGKYTLNFDDADLGEVAKVILGDILQVNYTISPQAGGKITLQTTRPLRREEVLPALEMVLQMNGLALARKNGFYWIGPSTEAVVGAPLGLMRQKLLPGYQIRIFPLRYVSVEAMEKILQPLLPPKAILHSDPTRNLMVVAGSLSELASLEDAVRTFDVNFLEGMSVGLFPLRNVDVETIGQDLENILGEKALGSSTALLRVLPIKRLNALMVITSQPDYLELAKTWISRLDRAIVEASGDVHVYRVQNVDAVKLADTLNQIFTGRGPKTPAATVAPGLKKKAVTGTAATKPAGPKPPAVSQGQGEIRIIADEPNNALIIIADQEDYRAIERVIRQLDTLPLQVLLDASIVEVTLTDDLQYGLQWFVQNKLPQEDNKLGLVDSGIDLPEAAREALLARFTQGFSYTFMGKSRNIGVLLRALASDSKLNVISSPSLMVLNNHEANIVVGDQISLRTGTFVNTATSTGLSQTFQQRDTGVQLTIKPRVNAGGLVIMELEQKVDDIGQQVGDEPNPRILQRSIKSTVAVKDGDTLVLGGLIKDNRNQSKQGIPFLHRLPFIGSLFGNTNKSLTRTELVVLITPRVVENRRDAHAITNEFKQRLREIYEIPGDYLEQPASRESAPEPQPQAATPAAGPQPPAGGPVTPAQHPPLSAPGA